MDNNALDLLAEKIYNIFELFNTVIIRMIKDKPSPYIVIFLDNEKNIIRYAINQGEIENRTDDFNKKQELLDVLNNHKAALLALWNNLKDNDNLNGLYSK